MSDATLFAAALEKADRAAFLDRACGLDPDQRRRVEALLAAHDRAGGLPDPADEGTRADDRLEPPESSPEPTFLEPPLRPDSLGRIGHYECLQLVGRGGFGIVFRAFDDVLQRVVAIKVLSPVMAATSPARQRFLREARGYAAVRHENVVQVHAIGADPLPHIVMEFVPGETLEHLLLRVGPMAAADVVRVGVQVARGLAAAHAAGVIHRDIKPANILLEHDPDWRAKLTDFGLARTTDDASLTQSGQVAGTPLYMAPEQVRGETLDHRADLFSLGSVLYSMCTGRPPFRAPTTLAVMKRVADDTPRPVREIIPEVPQGLCDVIARLHAKDPAGRFASASELADRLAACLTAPPAPAPAANAEPASPVPPARGRRSPYRWVAAVGVVAALGVAVAASRVPSKSPAGPTDPPPQPSAAPHDLAAVLTSPDWEWGPPENLGPGVNTAARELNPTLTADELELVFARDRRLWVARRTTPDEPFAAAEPLPPEINAGDRQTASITGDGLLLAFTGGPPERQEVWLSSPASRADPFGPAERLPEPVNAAAWTVAPVFSADGLTLLATGLRRGGPGKGDIVMFTRPTLAAAFGNETVLPEPVNSPAFDSAAWVSDDGRVLVRIRMEKPPFETRFHVRASRADAFGPPHAIGIGAGVPEVGRPWLSADGARVYFHSREVPGGSGDLDLWVSRRVPRRR